MHTFANNIMTLNVISFLSHFSSSSFVNQWSLAKLDTVLAWNIYNCLQTFVNKDIDLQERPPLLPRLESLLSARGRYFFRPSLRA